MRLSISRRIIISNLVVRQQDLVLQSHTRGLTVSSVEVREEKLVALKMDVAASVIDAIR